MAQKQRENFFRISTVIVDHGTELLIKVLRIDLSNTKMTFEEFINKTQHAIYHLCYNRAWCCQCQKGDNVNQHRILHPNQLEMLLDKGATRLKGHKRKHVNRYHHYCCCPARRSLSYTKLDISLLGSLLVNFSQNCSTNSYLKQSIHDLVKCRNKLYAHVDKARLTDTDYKTEKTEVESIILRIARFCNIENEMQQKLNNASKRPLDETTLMQYQNALIQQSSNDRDIEKHLTEQDEARDRRFDIIEDKIGKLDDHGRSNIIAHSEAHLAKHSNDDTYVITENVKLCCDILEKYNTLVIIAKAGGGKSKTSLQIAMMYQEKKYKPMLFESDEVVRKREVINVDGKHIIIAEDLFGRSNIDFKKKNLHRGIFDILHSCFQSESCKSKLIITIRGNDKIKQKLVKYKIFENDVFINLDDTLNVPCKKKILSKHMNKNGISICDCEKVTKFPKILCTKEVFETSDKSLKIGFCFFNAICSGEYEIQIGFPQTCYLFCSNKKITKQGKAYFTHTSQALLDEIDDLKSDGLNDKRIRNQYCVLVYAAIKNAIDLNDIDELHFLNILRSVYEKKYDKIIKSSLKDAVDVLEGTYLCKNFIKSTTEETKRPKFSEKYILQHNTILEAVKLSYGFDVDILPFCDIRFLQEYIRPTVHRGELNESKVLSFVDYKLLVKRLISMLSIDNKTCLDIGRYLNNVALQHRHDEIIQVFFQDITDVNPEQYTCLLNGLTNFGENGALVKLHPELCTKLMMHAGSSVFVALCRPKDLVDNDTSFVAMETDVLINTLYKLFGKREEKDRFRCFSWELGLRNDLSEVGNYVFEYLIVNKFGNIVKLFFKKLEQNNLQIIPIDIKDFLNGLLCKGGTLCKDRLLCKAERSIIISQYKDFFEEVLFKYGSIPVITEFCRPLTSTISSQNIIKIDDKLLAGKLSAHLEPASINSTQTVLRENGKYFFFRDHIMFVNDFIKTIALYIWEHGFTSNNVKFVQVMYEQLISHEKEQNSDTGSVDNENINMTDEASNQEAAQKNCAVNGKKVFFDGYPGEELLVDANGVVIESLSQVKVGSVKNVYREHDHYYLSRMTDDVLFEFLSDLKSMLRKHFSTPSTLIGLLKIKFERLLDNIDPEKCYSSSDSFEDSDSCEIEKDCSFD